MNLIHCQKDCVYQSDGYCGLDRAAAVTCAQLNQCSFYQNKPPLPSIRPDIPPEHQAAPSEASPTLSPAHDGAQFMQGDDALK